jgi:hypothetical protein
MKAQVSLEYLVILGLSMTIILAAVFVFQSYVKDASSDVVNSRVNDIGNQILQKAESVHGVGKGTWIVIDLEFPDELNETYIMNNTELVFEINTPSGVSQSVFYSNIPINGTIDRSLGGQYYYSGYPIGAGKRSIKIESKGDYVLLNAS